MSSVVRTGSIRRTAVRSVILCFLVVSAPVYIFLSYPAESSHQLAFAEWVAQVSHLPDTPVTIELREYEEGQRTREFVVKGTGTSPQVRRLIELARDAGLFGAGAVAKDGGKVSRNSKRIFRKGTEVSVFDSDNSFIFQGNRDELMNQIQGKVFLVLLAEFGATSLEGKNGKKRQE